MDTRGAALRENLLPFCIRRAHTEFSSNWSRRREHQRRINEAINEGHRNDGAAGHAGVRVVIRTVFIFEPEDSQAHRAGYATNFSGTVAAAATAANRLEPGGKKEACCGYQEAPGGCSGGRAGRICRASRAKRAAFPFSRPCLERCL